MTDDKTEPVRIEKKIFTRLLKLSWQYRAGCIKAILLQILLLAFTIFGLSLIGVGIDYIRHLVDAKSKIPVWPFGFKPPEDWNTMKVLCVIAAANIAFAVIRYFLTYRYSITIVRLLQQGIVVELRAKIYEKMQRLSFRFFDSRSSGTLINRVTGDVQSVRLFIDGVIIQGVVILISLTVYVTYMMLINVKLTLLCMFTVPLMWVVSVYFSRKLKAAYTKDRDNNDKMILDMVERVQGIHVVKGFAREKEELKLLANDNRAIRDHKGKIFWFVSLFHPTIDLLTQVNIVILLAYGGYLVIQKELPLGAGLIVFLGLLQRFSAQVNTLAGIIDNIQQSVAAAYRVFEVLDAPVEIHSPQNPVRVKKSQGGITFKSVSFEYEPGERVLDNVDFDIKPGQFVGILGTTGSGKSTLLSLIPRFYDVKMGAVLLDGKDIRKYDLDDLRRQIGIVFQESFLFSNTIAANISFGHPYATRDEVMKAAKIASAHDFISALPQGYDTIISESGSDLSGGQKQRLAIARSIILEPPILLLDDPTAAVDSETEKEIFEGIESAMKGRTTFMVTHRISVLRRADIVLVMHRGKIIQRGTHDDLIKEKGHYRRCAIIQSEDGDK
ncbi:MAG: ABC transporter ATP-binding protein [Victivallales bacterium]|jgi:ATP-binding cassette subfamily B protein